MPGRWNTIGLDTGPIVGTLDSASSVLESVVALLNAVQQVMKAASALVATFESVSKALINGIIALIEQSILNFLEPNVHLGIYSNIEYDPEWSWAPKAGQQPPNPNGIAGDAPISGSGMTGWLTTMSASTFDTTNPFRPVTDSATAVSGIIVVRGSPSFSEVALLRSQFAELFNFDDFKLRSQEEINELGYENRWQMIGGYFGTRASERSKALDEAAQTFDALVQAVDERAQDPLPEDPSSIFLNSPGPSWVGLPVASLLGEPVRQIAAAFRNFVNAFSFADTPIIQMLNAIIRKIEQIERLLRTINDLLQSLSKLFEFLQALSFYHAVEPSGGAPTFFANAASAEGVPNFGVDGVVVGVAALSTKSSETFESLLTLFGADVAAAFSAVSASEERLGATLASVEEAAAEVEWQE